MRAWEGLNPPYRTIVMDPPWEYPEGWPPWASVAEDARPRLPLPYSSLSVEALASLDVRGLAQAESYLFLWTTNRYLEAAYSLVRCWSFIPKQTVVWCKEPRGVGPGGMFATTTEFIVVAQRVGPRGHARHAQTTGKRMNTSWFQWPRGPHSVKPAAFYDVVEQVAPGPYVDLFARSQRLGWDAWGMGYELRK